MLKTVLRSTFMVPQAPGLHLFLGCCAPEGMPQGRALSFPQLDEDALRRVLELDTVLLRAGLTVVVDAAADGAPGTVLESMQKHLALQYCKYFFMPLIRDTIPDVYGVRDKSTEASAPFMPQRMLTMLRNVPLYLTSPLTDALERRAVGCPVYIVLGGPSLRHSGEALRRAARCCAVVCVARTLDFCLREGVEPDFVITLDTDWRYGQVLEGSPLKHTWLISLSMCNVAAAASRFAGVFFMESFHTGILRKKCRMRESWMSVAICTLGLAEVLHAPRIIVSGGDGCWSADSSGYVGYFDGEGNAAQEESVRVIALPESGAPREKPKKTFTVCTVGGHRAQTNLVYYATTAELDGIAREFRQRGVLLWQVGSRGILNPSLFSVLDPQDMATPEDWPELDREEMHQKIRLAHGSPLPLSLEALDQFLLSQQQMAEQCYITLLIQLQQGEDVSGHPLLSSMEICAEQQVFPSFPDTEWRAAGGLALCENWMRLLLRAKAYVNLYRHRREGKPVRLAHRRENVAALAQAVERVLPGLKLEPMEVLHWMLDPMDGEDALSRELFSGVLCGEGPTLVAPDLWRVGQDLWLCMGQQHYLELDDVLRSLPVGKAY